MVDSLAQHRPAFSMLVADITLSILVVSGLLLQPASLPELPRGDGQHAHLLLRRGSILRGVGHRCMISAFGAALVPSVHGGTTSQLRANGRMPGQDLEQMPHCRTQCGFSDLHCLGQS